MPRPNTRAVQHGIELDVALLDVDPERSIPGPELLFETILPASKPGLNSSSVSRIHARAPARTSSVNRSSQTGRYKNGPPMMPVLA
jgi:hypothetical protein